MNEAPIDINRAFGPRTWDDLRRSISVQVHRKWKGQEADIEDAVGDAILRLVEYWLDLDSSQAVVLADHEKAFGFARWYGVRFALNRLHHQHDELARLAWLDEPARFQSDDSEDDFTLGDVTPSAVDVEMAAILPDPEVAIGEFLSKAGEGPRKRWTEPIMDGEGARAQARREGVTHVAVVQGRRRACAELRPTAIDLGLTA